MSETSAYSKGVMGELAARDFLTRKGMRMIQANYRVVGGEIDLILQDSGTLVFVEVKSRKKNDLNAAEAAITPQKRQRIQLAAKCFLGEHPEWMEKNIRFDAVILLPDQMIHIPDAFSGMEW